MCHLRHPKMSQDTPTQRYGYLEIKQSSKVRPRKLRTWRRRWAVLTKLSNLNSDEYVAKLDLYEDEAKWRNSTSDKITFVLENVTSIQPTKSRTHKHAFEVVEKQPVLVLSGATELESYSWILTFQQMFTPEKIDAKKDTFIVNVSANEHSQKWSLVGEFKLTVSTTCISLVDKEGTCVISWGLSTLMRFNVEKDPTTGLSNLLLIECGPNAPTGQSCFHFRSDEAESILFAIRQSICLALAQKQNSRRPRTMSVTVSEKSFQNLLDNHPVFRTPSRERSGSDSSSLGSQTMAAGSPSLPRSPMSTGRSNSELRAVSETEEQATDGVSHLKKEEVQQGEKATQEDATGPHQTSTVSQHARPFKENGGYSVIKDTTTEEKPRRDTVSSEPHDFDSWRLRSVSVLEMSRRGNADDLEGDKSKRTVSFEDDNDDKSDMDSAISSMAFSIANGESPRKDHALYQDLEDRKGFEPFPVGQLSRRRSSSTPDLAAYRKHYASAMRFENVYEELDELRASVQRLDKNRVSEIPPELPARPVSMSFSSNSDQSTKGGAKKKRSLFRKHGKASTDPTGEESSKSKTNCTCENSGLAKGASVSDTEDCDVCVNNKSRFRKFSISKSPSKEELVGSINSSTSDIYASIPEVSMRRRRSSDITPVSFSQTLAAIKASVDTTKTGSLPTVRRDGARRAPQTKPHKEESLMTFGGSSGSDIAGTSSIQSTAHSLHCKPSDPLISFFLDDEQFETNPMVTGQLPAAPSPASSTNFDLLNNAFNQPSSPFSSTQIQQTTAPNSQGIKGDNQFSSDFDFPGPFCGAPMAQPSPLDIWGVNVISNISNNGSANCMVASPPFFATPFSPGVLAWNSVSNGFLPHTTNIQSNGSESNYMAMRGKPGSQGNLINSAAGQRSSTSLSDTSRLRSASVGEMDNIYVSPSEIAKQQ